MQIEISFYGVLKQTMGCTRLVVELPNPSGHTIADLAAHLADQQPLLAERLASLAFVVGAEIVRRDHLLVNGDSVALLPPVSGG
jgi:molybdopterin converting factor small subunit